MRIEGRKKLGFYPALPEVIEGVISRLVWERDLFGDLFPTTILDPCCGEGVALLQVAQVNPSTIPYGVELDSVRARKARKLFADHFPKEHEIIHSPYEDVFIGNESFGVLWLNPPYDNELGAGGERLEAKFLANLKDCLVQDGVLVFLIPGKVLKSVAETISSQFSRIAIFHGDKNWKQVILIGTKAKPAFDEESRNFDLLCEIGRKFRDGEEVDLPAITDTPAKTWSVPPVDPERTTFRGRKADLDTIESQIFKTAYLNNLSSALCKEERLKKGIQPVTPIRPAHLANILMMGAINGQMGTGDELHIVHGSIRRVLKKHSEVEEDGTVRETSFWKPETIISVAELKTGLVYDLTSMTHD